MEAPDLRNGLVQVDAEELRRAPRGLEGGEAFRGSPSGRAVPATLGGAPGRRRAVARAAAVDVVDTARVVGPHVGAVLHRRGVAGEGERRGDDGCRRARAAKG